MIVQKKKSARENQIDSSQMGYQSKNVLGPGSSNESLGNPVQTIGKGFNKSATLRFCKLKSFNINY